MAAWGEVIERFGNIDSPLFLEQVASAIANIGQRFAEAGLRNPWLRRA